jgi:hypothetical protein
MKRKPEIKRIDVVLLGNFNPQIFSPAWFAAHELIGEQESEAAELEIIHSDVTIFTLPWCRLQVTRERFSIMTEQEAYFGVLYDLVAATFKLLEHTPVFAFGYNWESHFKCDSEKEWHNFGYYLVPNEPWKDIFKDSGMIRVEVVEKISPEDPLEGALRIRVEPSNRIKPGIYFNINDHYRVVDEKKVIGCKTIINKFIDNWEISQNKSAKAIDAIFEKFLKEI